MLQIVLADSRFTTYESKCHSITNTTQITSSILCTFESLLMKNEHETCDNDVTSDMTCTLFLLLRNTSCEQWMGQIHHIPVC